MRSEFIMTQKRSGSKCSSSLALYIPSMLMSPVEAELFNAFRLVMLINSVEFCPRIAHMPNRRMLELFLNSFCSSFNAETPFDTKPKIIVRIAMACRCRLSETPCVL